MASKHTQTTADRTGHMPVRRCIVRHVNGDTAPLIRFAVAPGGTVVPDLEEKLPGRGLWVTASGACLREAVAKKLFARAAKQPAHAPADLPEQTAALLQTRVLALLGLAKKAGALALGAEAVAQSMRTGTLCAIITAGDAATATLADIQRRAACPVLHLPVSAAALGTAMGRDNAVSIGLLSTPANAALLRDAERLHALTKDL